MRIAVALLVCSAAVRAQVPQPTPQPTDARGWKNFGVELFRAGKYHEADRRF